MSIITLENISFQYDEADRPVFTGLNLGINEGVTSLVGPNGSGKTTLMLLAGGRLMPDKGEVTIFGQKSTQFTDEESRNLLVSFVYQNMEFETEDSVSSLMAQIYEAGAHDDGEDLPGELIRRFELESDKDKRTQELSKGALQRTIVAFSLLYGSPLVMMDEPLFAVEPRQRELIMEYLSTYAREYRTSFVFSAHELPLTRKYSREVLLFTKQGRIEQGSPAEILTEVKLEEAYGIPAAMLSEKESLHRKHLKEVAEQLRDN